MTYPNANDPQTPSQQQEVTIGTLQEAMMRFGNIPFDRQALDYLAPYRAQVRAAVLKRDGESLASYATKGVLGMLRNAGFEGHLMPQTLIKLIDNKGWDQIHDAIGGNRNAMALLTNAITEMQPMSAAPPPQREAPAPARHNDDRRPPQDNRQSQAQEPRQRQQQPAPSRSHHPLDGAESARQGGGVRRHDQTNVRSIHSHPNHPGNGEGADEGDAATREARRKGQKKVYGGKAALNFEVDTRRNGTPTIRLEAAKILNAEARTYDWKQNKIVIQLTTSELQKITALLLGLIKQAKFSNHGPKNDKWFEFQHQEDPKYAGTVKVAVGEGSHMCIVSITHEDIGDVTSLFLRQCAAAGGLDQAAVPAILRPVAQAYNLAVSNRGGGAGSGGGQRRHA